MNATQTLVIRTRISVQYSADDLGHVGPKVDHTYTTASMPGWLPSTWGPTMWEGKHVGAGDDIEVGEYLVPLFARHEESVPDGCNHVSEMEHTCDSEGLPRSLSKVLRHEQTEA